MLPRPLAVVLVFATSAAVLVLEILAGRILAPYVGVSLETFTGIIGVVLAGISLGAWLGGLAADRYPGEKLLGPLLVGGGVAAVLGPPLVDGLGSGIGTGPGAIVLLAIVGFFAPAAVLSAVPPVVVKLRLASLEETGSVVGRYSAIGTAGAIFGTFATGFVLVAAFPTRPIVWGVGGLSIVAGLVLTVRRGEPGAVGRMLVVGTAALALGGVAIAAGASPCDVETAYSCANVEVDPDNPSGRIVRLDTVRHSYADLADPTHLEFRYIAMLASVAESVAPEPEPIDVLYLGGGGFTLPRYTSVVRPGSSNLVLEIDPDLVALDEEELDLDLGGSIEVLIGDARVTLEDVPEGSFDLVVGDAFSGLSVPWHLTTLEYLEDVADRLRPGGVYAMNVIDDGPVRFLRAEIATMQEVWEHVALFGLPRQLAGMRGGNFIVAGSDAPIDTFTMTTDAADRGWVIEALTGEELDEFVGGARVLTDDWAPVDQLMTRR